MLTFSSHRERRNHQQAKLIPEAFWPLFSKAPLDPELSGAMETPWIRNIGYLTETELKVLEYGDRHRFEDLRNILRGEKNPRARLRIWICWLASADKSVAAADWVRTELSPQFLLQFSGLLGRDDVITQVMNSVLSLNQQIEEMQLLFDRFFYSLKPEVFTALFNSISQRMKLEKTSLFAQTPSDTLLKSLETLYKLNDKIRYDLQTIYLPDLYHDNFNNYIGSLARKLLNPETTDEPSLVNTLVEGYPMIAERCFKLIFLSIPPNDAEQLQNQIREILQSNKKTKNFFNKFVYRSAMSCLNEIDESWYAWLEQEIQNLKEKQFANIAFAQLNEKTETNSIVSNAQFMQNLGHFATSVTGQSTSMPTNNNQDDDNDVENAPAFE